MGKTDKYDLAINLANVLLTIVLGRPFCLPTFDVASGPNVINIYGRKFIAKKYVYVCGLSCNS
jgi:hypothetical protein